jgi:pyoverdine/dityrosine biosynthesis protein Dit1
MKNLGFTPAHNLSTDQLAQTTTPNLKQATELGHKLMQHVMRFRRMATSEQCCESATCAHCLSPHFPKVTSAIMQGKPITFILPAFPGKSPNSAKVLGNLPDRAEQSALEFLNDLCERISCVYPAGAKLVICSDGRVFSDVVGIPETDITAYQDELDKMIKRLGLSHLSTFNLDELISNNDFDTVRSDLMQQYGQPLETLREKVRRGGRGSESSEDKEAHRMYCGITRFLFEDSLVPGQTKSRTSLQKVSRAKAYEVIRRSNAWSELLARHFPEAVRLSIHPQSCGSQKLGIQLLGDQTWLTPWHGVAVENDEGFVLMKRWEAEKMNLPLVKNSEGRPSHFKMV